MSEVPWAPGRKALVMTEWGWRAGFGRKSRGAEPDFWIVPEDGASGATWERRISAEGRATAMLPEQCPRCFEVVNHQSGCMVAANLVRGVPAFWAPWVMETPPTVPNARLCYGLLRNGQAIELQWYSRNGVPPTVWEGWETPNRLDAEEIDDLVGYFALNADGPTLLPWGLG